MRFVFAQNLTFWEVRTDIKFDDFGLLIPIKDTSRNLTLVKLKWPDGKRDVFNCKKQFILSHLKIQMHNLALLRYNDKFSIT